MRSHIAALTIVAALALHVTAQERQLPDPSSGVIEGKPAVLLWPADDRVDGCYATLVPETDPDVETQYPCGEWFVPPFGRYKVWLEGPSSISAAPTRIVYQSTPVNRMGRIAVFQTASAGEIGLRAAWPGTSLRMVNLDSFASGDKLAAAFDRRASADAVRPVRMPTGRVLAGIFDRKTGDAVAIARPVQVTTGGMAYAEPALPKAGTDVLVVLDRPRVRHHHDTDVVEVQLEVDGRLQPPAVFADSADRLYAVWYGVGGRRARVGVNGRELAFPGREFLLRPKSVVTVRGQLRLLPKLRVEVAPALDLPRELRVEVRRLSGDTVVDVPLDTTDLDLGPVPAEPLDVLLQSAEFELRQRMDLTEGLDETVRFQPKSLTVRGRVTRGGRGVRATVAFAPPPKKPVVVNTGPDGDYTATLWRAGVYRLSASASGMAPLDLGARHLTSDTELNIDLPRAHVTVEAIDEKFREGVAGAVIIARSVDAGTERRDGAQRAVTNGEGSADFPPMPPGTTELYVQADGYIAAERIVNVRDQDDPQRFTVELTRADAADQVTIHLPDGAPAAGAELLLIDAATMQQPLWSGRTDASGAVAVPRLARAVLLVRHAQAGSLPVIVRDGLDLQLPSPAAPLAVRFVTPAGAPAAYAGVAIWVGGVRLTGSAMGFLYGTHNATDKDGVWRARNLPPAPLRIITVGGQSGTASPEALDALASTIEYPWPAFPIIAAAP